MEVRLTRLISPVGDEPPPGPPLPMRLDDAKDPPELYPDDTDIFRTARCHCDLTLTYVDPLSSFDDGGDVDALASPIER